MTPSSYYDLILTQKQKNFAKNSVKTAKILQNTLDPITNLNTCQRLQIFLIHVGGYN